MPARGAILHAKAVFPGVAHFLSVAAGEINAGPGLTAFSVFRTRAVLQTVAAFFSLGFITLAIAAESRDTLATLALQAFWARAIGQAVGAVFSLVALAIVASWQGWVVIITITVTAGGDKEQRD